MCKHIHSPGLNLWNVQAVPQPFIYSDPLKGVLITMGRPKCYDAATCAHLPICVFVKIKFDRIALLFHDMAYVYDHVTDFLDEITSIVF